MGTENKGFEQLFVDILQSIKKRPVPEISVEQQINTPTPLSIETKENCQSVYYIIWYFSQIGDDHHSVRMQFSHQNRMLIYNICFVFFVFIIQGSELMKICHWTFVTSL